MSHPLQSAPSLRDLQRWFAAVTTSPAPLTEAIAAAPLPAVDGGVANAAWIRSSDRRSAEQSLQVYRHAYYARLTDCLRDDYPALAGALDQAFVPLCRRYIACFPPRSPSLNRFGEHMAAYCRTETGPHADFYAELAQLEWAIVEVIHAQDAQPLSPAELGALSPEAWAQRVLVPNPALRLLLTEYPVNAYYQAFREQACPAVPAPEASVVVVRRRGGPVTREPETIRSGNLLKLLLQSEPIGRALEAAAGGGMSVSEVSQCFERWLSHGYFVGLG